MKTLSFKPLLPLFLNYLINILLLVSTRQIANNLLFVCTYSAFLNIQSIPVAQSKHICGTTHHPYGISNSVAAYTAVSPSTTRVRFAPSPSGRLHIGGARTAILNWLLAQHCNGTMIIRIEDSNPEAVKKGSEASILADLRWLGVTWDEGPDVGGAFGPYRQSERSAIYKRMALELVKLGYAYWSTEGNEDDTVAMFGQTGSNLSYAIKFRVPNEKIVSINDIVRGNVSWNVKDTVGDFVLLRSNGLPVYNFCAAVDDALMNITHVIRAEDHLTNTLRQILVLEALNFPIPIYGHCSLILGANKVKLSKRRYSTAINDFKDDGFLPEGVLNYLALLGWNDGTTREFFTPDDLIKLFTPYRLVKSAASFDVNKLRWMNGYYMKLLNFSELYKAIALQLQRHDILDSNRNELENKQFISLATQLWGGNITVAVDIIERLKKLLKYPLVDSLANQTHFDEPSALKVFKLILKDYRSKASNELLSFLNYKEPKEEVHDASCEVLWKRYIQSLNQRLRFKGKLLLHPLRLAFTGLREGPSVYRIVKLVLEGEKIGVNGLITLEERFQILEAYIRKKQMAHTI